jgi:hypothetical protein
MARTDAEKTQDYTAMGHSVGLINAVIAGEQMADDDATDRQDCVDRNVEHLELMKAKDDWGSEDMAATTKAITDGKAYKAS